MRIVLFCHSLVSDWNHGNAHFLRGIVAELQDRAHDVRVFEPADGWSRQQLVAEAGAEALHRFAARFPSLTSDAVDFERLDLDEALDGANLVLVHEWTPPALVARIGRHRRTAAYTLLFHDTHHRSVSDAPAMSQYDLEDYDGVLAFGEVIRQRYLAMGWSRRAWTWHEAADVRVFHPRPDVTPVRDVVWVGNWGDDERTAEIQSFLIEPVRELGLSARVHGVRYPADGVRQLRDAGIEYAGWLPNYEAPGVYARHRATVHIPRRPYVEALPGIPTIRVFEALACGIPLVSVRWEDCEHLFTPGEDYLLAGSPAAMRDHLRAVTSDRSLRDTLAGRGRRTILERHTCAHRVDELMSIVGEIEGKRASEVLIA